MSAAQRQQAIARLHKALRTQYRLVPADTGRPLLEQVLYACCLENAPYDVAQKAYARLGESFFDLNEVRVTTVAELAEVLHDLPDPARAALSLRRVLQSVFESSYSFSLESARKHSLAHGVKTLEGLHGVPPFVVAQVASTALGGHFIPVDLGALQALFLAGIVSREEYDAGKAAGLERLIAKKNGPEFSSLLHQFGVEVLGNLHGTTVRRILQSVNPDLKDRFPKRGEPLPRPSAPVGGALDGERGGDGSRGVADEHRPAGPQAAARPAGKTPLPPPGSGPKRTADGRPLTGGKPGPKPFVVKPNVGRPPPPVEIVPPPAATAEPIKPEAAKAAGGGKGATAKGSGRTRPAEPAGKGEAGTAPAPERPAKKASGAKGSGVAKERPPATGKTPPKVSGGGKGSSKSGAPKPPARKPDAKGAAATSAQLSRRKPR